MLISLLSEGGHRLRRQVSTSSRTRRNEPKGPQRPHPPICIGGSGEEAHAAARPHVPTPNTGISRRGDARRGSRASATSWPRAAPTSGATRRRITLSAHLRLGARP